MCTANCSLIFGVKSYFGSACFKLPGFIVQDLNIWRKIIKKTLGGIKKKGSNVFFLFQMILSREAPHIMGHISLFHVALKKPSHPSETGCFVIQIGNKSMN